MSGATIRNAVAAKIATLASAGSVYSAGSTLPSGVASWPQELVDDGPHALVGRGPSGRSGGTGNQWVTRGVDVEWRFSLLDRAEAERLMDALEDEIVVAFSAGITLNGAIIDLIYGGSERPVPTQDQTGKPWLTWITHFTARERFATEMTP